MPSTKKGMVFNGTPTTTEERNELKKNGFVHVTGLTTHCSFGEPYVIGEKTKENDLGQHGDNNGMISLITTGGEVWLRASGASVSYPKDVLNKFCPNGGGAFVPCSNGEILEFRDVLLRHANPSYGFDDKK